MTARGSLKSIALCFAFMIVLVGRSGAGLAIERPTILDDPIERTLTKIVKIYGAGGVHNLEAYGSGFLVSAEGHVVTVWNHLIDSGEVSVVLNDGRRFSAKFLNGDPKRDLAVLKIDSDDHDFPHFDLAKVAQVPEGTRVLGFSNMFKVAAGDEPVSVVHGVVAVRTKLTGRRGAFQTDYDGTVYVIDGVTNNPGAAGGAITTLEGRLIGMIGRELRNAQSNTWVNYAIPVVDLHRTIDDIVAGRFSPPPSRTQAGTGARWTPLELGLVMVPDVVYRTPAYVEGVVPNSPAAKAGIQVEDLIVFVNDELVQSDRVLKEIIGRLEAGDSVHVVVRRKDKLVALQFLFPNVRSTNE